MVTKKGEIQPYRDDPDRDDAASTSSAVLLEDIDFPDEDLPAYEDTPSVVTEASSAIPAPNGDPYMSWYWYVNPPPLNKNSTNSNQPSTRPPLQQP